MDKLGPYNLNSIVTGDARKLAEAIPDESIDMIFTDPPYLKEFIYLYEWLAKIGKRILKPGGYVFAYGASEHMPARLAGMSKHLDYFWTFALLHNGGYPRLWAKKLMSGYKPVFVYTKGKPTINPWMSTVHTVSMDKRFHKWGQGEGFPMKVIDMLTLPGDTIFDPFTGGGQIPAVCKMLKRDYLAFELDDNTANDARQRVQMTNPPLLILEPIQNELRFA